MVECWVEDQEIKEQKINIMENTTKEAAHKYAEAIAQDEVKKIYSRADFEAGANWMQKQMSAQFEEMKTALERIANTRTIDCGLHTLQEIASEALTSLTETNEKH